MARSHDETGGRCSDRIDGRGLESELELGADDGLPAACVASFDTVFTLDGAVLRRLITRLDEVTMHWACERLNMALGC